MNKKWLSNSNHFFTGHILNVDGEIYMSIVPLMTNDLSKGTDISYDIEFKIGSEDYTKGVFKVQLGSSLDMIFGLVTIGFQCTTREANKNKLFGQKDISLKITQTTLDRTPLQELDLNLISLKINWADDNSDSDEYTKEEAQQYKPRKIYMICVQKEAFLAQYTLVNKLFQSGSKIIPIDAVKQLAIDNLTIEKSISEENSNKDIIPQMIIPPTSFINAFRYIDSKYPIYNGSPLICFVQFYNSTLTIWDLRKKFTDKADYKIKFITKGSKDDTDIKESPGNYSDVPVFYTTDRIKRAFDSNKKTTVSFYNNSFITKPRNKISNYIETTAEKVFNSDGLTKPESNILINDSLKKLRRVNSEIITSQYSDILPRRMISSQISSSFDITFTIEGPNYPFLRLTEIGGGIDIESNDEIYKQYLGRYVTKKNVLSFERHENAPHYNLFVVINCIRGFCENE